MKHVTQWKIQCYMPYSHQVLCLACQESCLIPQLLWQHLSKNDSCHTSWLNSGNSGTLLTVLCSPNPTKKNARAQWSEFNAIESDDDDDDNFLYHQLPVYHCNPANESDDSLSDISYHNKHDNLSSDLLCQEDEQINSHLQGNKVILHLKGKVDLMKKPILHLKGMLDLMKKLILHLKVQMDQALAPVDPSTPIQALSFLQMMKQHSALPHSFPRTKLIFSNLSL